ncbi:MAG: hypothetical protein LBG88_01700 [Christensenellaceae bacterium]|nr:hypothetical protein [Christensenellaceae bacterium]
MQDNMYREFIEPVWDYLWNEVPFPIDYWNCGKIHQEQSKGKTTPLDVTLLSQKIFPAISPRLHRCAVSTKLKNKLFVGPYENSFSRPSKEEIYLKNADVYEALVDLGHEATHVDSWYKDFDDEETAPYTSELVIKNELQAREMLPKDSVGVHDLMLSQLSSASEDQVPYTRHMFGIVTSVQHAQMICDKEIKFDDLLGLFDMDCKKRLAKFGVTPKSTVEYVKQFSHDVFISRN